MKKNVMMRVASVLLIAVLMSTCVISGTFAKYTTSDEGSDSARVAKWGVSVNVWSGDDSDVFNTSYSTDNDDIKSTITTSVSSTEKIVAPGTTGSIQFSIAGKPEVATRVTVDVADNYTDISIPQGTEVAENNTLAAAYNPVKFTLKKGETAVAGATDISLAEMVTKLEGLTANYEANSDDLAATYTLSWTWEYDNANGANDAADTYLANVAAGTQVGAEGVVTTISFELGITVTQID